MKSFVHPPVPVLIAVATLVAWAYPAPVGAQPEGSLSQTALGSRGIGMQGFGIAGVNWPVATKSLEATALEMRPREFGGGLQVTDIWRTLFCQVTATRTASSGERAFVDADGTSFPLGIPLSVRATYVDVGAGWKFGVGSQQTPRSVVPYFAGGMGVVRYKETSPFAEADDDIETSSISYHVLGGVEVRLLKWLGVSADVGYRHVPGLLGSAGVSSAFGEDDFGGVRAGMGLRIVFDGPRRSPATAPESPEPSSRPMQEAPPGAVRGAPSNSGVVITAAPVFLRMDPTLEPLRTLEPGTSLKIMADIDDWVRVEFYDRLLGPRVGYIQRKYVAIPK